MTRPRACHKIRITKLYHWFQNAGKRKKRGRVVGGHAIRSNTEYLEYIARLNSGNFLDFGTQLMKVESE